MTGFITPVLAYGAVALDVTIVFVFLAYVSRRSWGRDTVRFIGSHALGIGFLLSLAAVAGSLLYSNVIGYTPCDLCWWQRICLYPTVLLFAAALYKKDRNVFRYILPLAAVAGVIALYHSYIQWGGSTSILPCTAVGGACAKVFVREFGFVTIPSMSLAIAVSLILLSITKRAYDDNRNP